MSDTKSYTVEIGTMVYATVQVDAESREAAMEAVLEGDALPRYFVQVSPVAGSGVEVRLDNKGWEATDADVYGIDDEESER